MCAKSLQLRSTLCDAMDCSLPGSPVHGILQARILEWVAISCSRGSSHPGTEPTSLMSPALAGGFFTTSTTQEVPQSVADSELLVGLYLKFSLFLVIFLLRCNSHNIKFALKVYNFVIFEYIQLCNHYHYLIPELSSFSITNSILISSHSSPTLLAPSHH